MRQEFHTIPYSGRSKQRCNAGLGASYMVLHGITCTRNYLQRRAYLCSSPTKALASLLYTT